MAAVQENRAPNMVPERNASNENELTTSGEASHETFLRNIVEARSLSKSFIGELVVEAVSDVNFSLNAGQFLALVGRSGSGKSTLMGMLGGISKPTSGSILIGGVDIWKLKEDERTDFRNKNIGFVFQFASLLPTLRAIDNVALPALVSGSLSYSQAYERAEVLLSRVGLANRRYNYPSQLSGGEQRRVAIARALINAPTLLLADEPTADLDQETEEEILNLLVDVQRSLRLSLVVVTHSASVAAMADRCVEMRAGKVFSDDSLSNAWGGANLPAMGVKQTEERQTVEQLFETEFDGKTQSGSSSESVKLGEGFERLLGRFVLYLVPFLFLIAVAHIGVETYQRSLVDAALDRKQAVEDLAMKGLRADVKDIRPLSAGKYAVKLYLRNVSDGQDLFVMAPTVRAFVQIGSSWQEVPLKAAGGNDARVLKITGTRFLDYVLEPDVPDFAQLIPYYMHVRISSDMLVSPSSEPKADLIERNDNYYVYLKPQNLDDVTILSKLKFPGAPPVWIPMPPH